MYEKKIISISNLLLDEENFRIGDQQSQRDCVSAIIQEQSLKNGKNKIFNLAKSIATEGLSPIEPIVVIPDYEISGTYIVKEGNRRIAALKILYNPNLINEPVVRKLFENLSNSKNICFDIECNLIGLGSLNTYFL